MINLSSKFWPNFSGHSGTEGRPKFRAKLEWPDRKASLCHLRWSNFYSHRPTARHTQDLLHKTPRRRRHWHSDQLQSPPSSPPFVQPIKLINNVESYLITSNAMAPPIATPTPQRRGDGFTIMEGKLKTLFFDQFKSKSPTVEGLAHTTRRHLTIAFSGAVNSKGPPKSAVQSTQSPVKDHVNRRYNLHNLFGLHQITPPRVISPSSHHHIHWRH
jgi:hypothetical protein